MDALTATLVIHAAATLAMGGVIWFVQVVHYPMMALVPADAFGRYERVHQQRTTRVVGPLMLAEATSAALLVWLCPPESRWLAWLGIALLAAVWASTFGVQVPLHARLERGFDTRTHRRLVATNWVRTALWTARGGLALWLLRAP